MWSSGVLAAGIIAGRAEGDGRPGYSPGTDEVCGSGFLIIAGPLLERLNCSCSYNVLADEKDTRVGSSVLLASGLVL